MLFQLFSGCLLILHLQIILVSFGLHYNKDNGKNIQEIDNGHYFNHMQLFLLDCQAMLSNSNSSLKVYFIQTFFQHFSNSENGYYNGSSNACASFVDDDVAAEKDWRNRIADLLLIPAKIPIIRISSGLKSQWDAHMGHGDCTHYCYPSGVFTYIMDVLYNSLLVQ
jgi:hypothetical protein